MSVQRQDCDSGTLGDHSSGGVCQGAGEPLQHRVTLAVLGEMLNLSLP